MSDFVVTDLQSVFHQLSESRWSGILIGGQAVNLYANHYAAQIPEIDSFQPLASRDLDFHGGPREAKLAMEILHAKGKINDGTDPSPNAGLLEVRLASGETLIIDILTSVFGVSASETIRSSITWKFASETTIHVIHPLLLLESKQACLRSLDQTYRQDNKHVRLMTHVLLAWFGEQLDSPRDVYKSIERLAAMMMTPDGLSSFDHGIDLWQAIPLEAMRADPKYKIFFQHRYPQLVSQISGRRGPGD